MEEDQREGLSMALDPTYGDQYLATLSIYERAEALDEFESEQREHELRVFRNSLEEH